MATSNISIHRASPSLPSLFFSLSLLCRLKKSSEAEREEERQEKNFACLRPDSSSSASSVNPAESEPAAPGNGGETEQMPCAL